MQYLYPDTPIGRQRAFDKMATHLMKQFKKSMIIDSDGDPICYYRHPTEKLMCAVGAIIPKSKYDPSMEEQGPDATIFEQVGLWPMDYDAKIQSILQSMQTHHDTSDVEDWYVLLGNLARRHDLTTDALEAAAKKYGRIPE